MTWLDWLAGGERRYHVLEHCMSGDTGWAWALAGLSGSLLVAYLGIAAVWWRASRAGPPNEARRLLRVMVAIFVLCGLVHQRATISLWWPGYRLSALLLVPLNVASWLFLARSLWAGVERVFMPATGDVIESMWRADGVGVAYVLPGGDQVWRANPALAAMFGCGVEELEGRSLAEITHPDDLAADLAQWERVKRGESDSYSMRKRYRYFGPGGGWWWGRLTVSARRGAGGRVLHSVSQVVRIQDEQDLRERLALTNSLLRRELEAVRQARREVGEDADAALARLDEIAARLEESRGE